MKQSEIAKWLKGIAWAIGGMGAVFFFLLVPALAGSMCQDYPEAAYLYWPGLVYGWVIAAICYAMLLQFWNICTQIGRDNSFSMENAMAFKRMSRMAVLMAVLWFAGIVSLVVMRWVQPAIMLFMIFAMLLSFIAAICTAALSHLVLKAYELKQENELTI